MSKEIAHTHEDPCHQRQFHIGEHIAEHGENKRKHHDNDQHQQNDQHQRIRQSTLDLRFDTLLFLEMLAHVDKRIPDLTACLAGTHHTDE